MSLGFVPVIISILLCELITQDTAIYIGTGIGRDIPKIIKFKATTSLRISCLFCIFKHSPQKTV
ncbi:hypothetical protein BACFIN_08854 [Bacteroides finegoldii DSM 17565]|nr:hypothetical protein BACFIN_08854 [Bacteroides finegoldii DSM 17565]